MEQEVPVIIHNSQSTDPVKEPQSETNIPELLREFSENLTDAFARFRESDSYDRLASSVEKAREYVRKNPAQTLLYSLGAGALFGLFMKRKR
ncbi:MAG: hypothetical protein FDX18_08195 [Chlorobium sp.]|nr:MAG: hypothetical protein FDX18_08195 [Chlorobium sp.]